MNLNNSYKKSFDDQTPTMPTRKKSNLTNNKARKWKNVLASKSNEDFEKRSESQRIAKL